MLLAPLSSETVDVKDTGLIILGLAPDAPDQYVPLASAAHAPADRFGDNELIAGLVSVVTEIVVELTVLQPLFA